MATTPEATIPGLLMTHLSALSLAPPLPIAWPEVPFTPPSDAPYLDTQFLPNIVARQFVADGGEYRYEGLFQVTVVYPRNRGIIAANETAGLIAAHFHDATVLASVSPEMTVRITSKPIVAAPLPEAACLRVPVTIKWRAFF